MLAALAVKIPGLPGLGDEGPGDLDSLLTTTFVLMGVGFGIGAAGPPHAHSRADRDRRAGRDGGKRRVPRGDRPLRLALSHACPARAGSPCADRPPGPSRGSAHSCWLRRSECARHRSRALPNPLRDPRIRSLVVGVRPLGRIGIARRLVERVVHIPFPRGFVLDHARLLFVRPATPIGTSLAREHPAEQHRGEHERHEVRRAEPARVRVADVDQVVQRVQRRTGSGRA